MEYLDWRVRLFSAAAVLAMVGMALSVQWVVWVAVVLLIVAFFLRFRPHKNDLENGSSETEEDRE